MNLKNLTKKELINKIESLRNVESKSKKMRDRIKTEYRELNKAIITSNRLEKTQNNQLEKDLDDPLLDFYRRKKANLRVWVNENLMVNDARKVAQYLIYMILITLLFWGYFIGLFISNISL